MSNLLRGIVAAALTITLAADATCARAAEPAATPAAVKIVFDTDLDTDCDDLGALAMLHALADRGEAEILATLVSSAHAWSPACLDAMNAYYGRPDLPLGAPRRGIEKPSKYARPLAERFPHKTPPGTAVPVAAEVCRRVLLAQPERSVTLVTVGYLTNVAELLKLPAEENLPSGLETVRRHVKRWVCMGGNFVGRPAQDDLKLGNNNFTFDAPAALYAVRHWPGDIVFVGREIGSVPSGLRVGAKLRDLPDDHPLRVGYALWFGGLPQDRHVADQTTVLYAVRGLGDRWTLDNRGYMDLQPDMTFQWRYDRDPGHAYLLNHAENTVARKLAIEREIEQLMMQPRRPPR